MRRALAEAALRLCAGGAGGGGGAAAARTGLEAAALRRRSAAAAAAATAAVSGASRAAATTTPTRPWLSGITAQQPLQQQQQARAFFARAGGPGGAGRGATAAALPLSASAAAATAPAPTPLPPFHHQQLRAKSSALARLRRLQRRRATRPATQASWAAVRPLLEELKRQRRRGEAGGGGDASAASASTPSPPPPPLVPSALPLQQHGESTAEEEPDSSSPPPPPAQVAVVGRIAAPYLPPPPQDAFAVVQIGPFQYKVSAGDVVFHPRIRGAEVNDVLLLGRVLLAGGKEATAVGRPFVPGAGVVAAVEEHFKDAKVRVFKKKKRKRYSKSYGHRSHLTALRVLEVRCAEVGAGGGAGAA